MLTRDIGVFQIDLNLGILEDGIKETGATLNMAAAGLFNLSSFFTIGLEWIGSYVTGDLSTFNGSVYLGALFNFTDWFSWNAGVGISDTIWMITARTGLTFHF